MWYVISVYSDYGDFEIDGQGTKDEASAIFQSKLRANSNLPNTDLRNVTDFQFEVWVEQHYQNDMKPGCAYTVRLTDNLPSQKKH